MIYLDNAATTRVSPNAAVKMLDYLVTDYGNPGTKYGFGRRAQEAVKDAREKVSQLIGAQPDHVVFTSGGSEANVMALKSGMEWMKRNGKSVVAISAVEHDSVWEAAKSMCIKFGFYLQILPVLSNGEIDIDALREILMSQNVGLVSVMYVNNELGCINKIDTIAELCHAHGALVHTDAVQAISSNPINVGQCPESMGDRSDVDYLSISAHKIHGPKGIGALYAKSVNFLSPVIYGGDNQEFGVRGGTENVPGIVGFGIAASELVLEKSLGHSSEGLLCKFFQLFNEEFGKISGSGIEKVFTVNGLSGDAPRSDQNILSITLHGVDAQTFQLAADAVGVCIGVGSACHGDKTTPSRVLKSIGLSDEDAMCTIRVSVSSYNTEQEIELAVKLLAEVYRCLVRNQS